MISFTSTPPVTTFGEGMSMPLWPGPPSILRPLSLLQFSAIFSTNFGVPEKFAGSV